MPVNALAENIFGTIGPGSRFHSRTRIILSVFFGCVSVGIAIAIANRRDLMDGPTHPTTHQNLAHQIHRGSFTLARVSLLHPTLQNDRILYSDGAQSALNCT